MNRFFLLHALLFLLYCSSQFATEKKEITRRQAAELMSQQMMVKMSRTAQATLLYKQLYEKGYMPGLKEKFPTLDVFFETLKLFDGGEKSQFFEINKEVDFLGTQDFVTRIKKSSLEKMDDREEVTEDYNEIITENNEFKKEKFFEVFVKYLENSLEEQSGQDGYDDTDLKNLDTLIVSENDTNLLEEIANLS